MLFMLLRAFRGLLQSIPPQAVFLLKYTLQYPDAKLETYFIKWTTSGVPLVGLISYWHLYLWSNKLNFWSFINRHPVNYLISVPKAYWKLEFSSKSLPKACIHLPELASYMQLPEFAKSLHVVTLAYIGFLKEHLCSSMTMNVSSL